MGGDTATLPKPIDLQAHEPPLEPVLATTCLSNQDTIEKAKRLKTQVELLVRQAEAASPVSVVEPLPDVLPDSARGLSALPASTIRKILAEKHLPFGDNKKKNVSRLLAHVKQNGTALDAAAANADEAMTEETNPFLNGFSCDALSRDGSAVQTYVLSLRTVATSVHGGLGDCCDLIQ